MAGRKRSPPRWGYAVLADYRLVISGEVRRGCEKYMEKIRRTIGLECSQAGVITRIEYIPVNETELYFKAADVLVLPYTYVFQTGVLFLGYAFGLPVDCLPTWGL